MYKCNTVHSQIAVGRNLPGQGQRWWVTVTDWGPEQDGLPTGLVVTHMAPCYAPIPRQKGGLLLWQHLARFSRLRTNSDTSASATFYVVETGMMGCCELLRCCWYCWLQSVMVVIRLTTILLLSWIRLNYNIIMLLILYYIYYYITLSTFTYTHLQWKIKFFLFLFSKFYLKTNTWTNISHTSTWQTRILTDNESWELKYTVTLVSSSG